MRYGSHFSEKMKNYLLFGGISKEEYDQVQKPVAEANHKALTYWSVLVSFFWIYCLLMSLEAEDYKMCRPAYAISLGCCILTFLYSRFLAKRFPDTLSLFKFIFRFSLLAGGVGIAVCQWNLRSLTMFAVAIILHSGYGPGKEYYFSGNLFVGAWKLHIVFCLRISDRQRDQQGTL